MLSLDLRKRIVSACGASFAAVGRRFSVSGNVMSKLVRQKQRGTLEPQAHERSRNLAFDGEKRPELLQHLKEHPNATVLERLAGVSAVCMALESWKTGRMMAWDTEANKMVPADRLPPRPSAAELGED